MKRQKFCLFIAIMLTLVLSACSAQKSSVGFKAEFEKGDGYNLFKVTEVDEGADVKLRDVISYYNENGQANVAITDGFINSFDDITLQDHEFVAIYTNDDANANADWGTYELNGVTYGSAVSGINDLPVKASCNYLLVIQKY